MPQVKRDKLGKKMNQEFLLDTVILQRLAEFSNHINEKILVSKDVKFVEDKQWNWEESMKKPLEGPSQYFDDDI